jgi:hypothetical protein
MGVTVEIGTEVRGFEEVNESWINDQIGRRRRDGAAVCVIVTVQSSGLDLRLTTPGCGGGGGGGRLPNRREQEIFDLWNERKLNSADFAGGNVVAFLKQLRRFI